MKTASLHEVIPNASLHKVNSEKDYASIQNYYDIAGPDYEVWSSHFNMHFGYIRNFQDIFFLERMLENMSDEVINELRLDKGKSAFVADLGCGVGAVARHLARLYPLVDISGFTISKYQVDKACSLNIAQKLDQQVTIINDNFESLSAADESFTHAYALESACHGGGSNKERFIAELARTLKKGGRFCIADGFLKNDR